MHEEVRRAVILRELVWITAVADPGNTAAGFFEVLQAVALLTFANDEKMEVRLPGLAKLRKGVEQRLRVLFRGQTADVEEQPALFGNAESGARGVIAHPRMKDVRVHSEFDHARGSHAPIGEELRERARRD